jgi:hypothetical protein
VKLGKNGSEISAMLTEVYVGEAMRKSNVFEWRKPFKEGSENLKTLQEVVQDFTQPIKMSKGCGIWSIQDIEDVQKM